MLYPCNPLETEAKTRLELRQLKYFVGIVEAGSVSRAASSLHVAQPALSAQIARLEEELGTRLLTRSVRGVTPTAAGTAVYEQARRILKQVEATQAIATQADQGPAGPVSIGLPWTVTTVVGLRLLQQMRVALPGVRLTVIEGPSATLAQLLEQGRLDIAVLFDSAEGTGLLAQPVVEEPLLLVGARGSLAGRTRCTLADVAALPLLLLSRPNGIRESIERLWAAQGHSAQAVAEVNAPALLIEAVQAGVGFAVLPACALEDKLQRGELDALPIAEGSLTRSVCLCSSRVFAPTPAAEQVLALLTQLMHEAVQQGRWQARWMGGAMAQA